MKPASYQIEASQFMYERDHSMVWARPGTGKTLATLLAIQDWIETGAAKRVLIEAPLRVCHNVWQQEIEKWKLPLTSAIYTGEVSRAGRAAAIAADTHILISNYDLLPQLLQQEHRCDAVVYDELSKLRNPTGKRNKLAKQAGFKIATGLTGSPAPRGLESLYGMSNAVGLKLFGRNYDLWHRKYFYPIDINEYRWEPLPGARDELVRMLKPYVFTLEDDAVELPPIVRTYIDVDLPDDLQQTYREMRATSVLPDHDIIAGSAGVLAGKLRQIAAGFVYDNAGSPVAFDEYRIDLLADLVDEQQGQPLLVMYEWVEQLAMLRARWPNAPWLGAGAPDPNGTLQRWNRGELPLLFGHPASMGHGNNMAAGGNAICWLQPPNDYELFEQGIGRLQRRDQPNARVYSYEIAALNTLDIAVRGRLAEKSAVQTDLWSAIRTQ